MSVFNRSGSSVHSQSRTHKGNGKGRRAAVLVATAALAAVGNRHAFGATATWTGAVDGTTWSFPGNWNATTPGASDTALFDEINSGPTITLTGNQNVNSIIFDNPNAGTVTSTEGAYTIGASGSTNALLLSNGGVIANGFNYNTSTPLSPTSTSDVSISQNINAPLVLEGSSYTFESLSTTASIGLTFNGQISGGEAGVTTLNLEGNNPSVVANQVDDITGPIVNGAATQLNLVVNITAGGSVGTTGNNGVWVVGNTTAGAPDSTYTGTTTINNGTLRVVNPDGISPFTDVTVTGTSATNGNASANLRDDYVGTVTIHSLTLENASATGTSVGGSATITTTSTLALTAETNPGLTFYSGTVNASLSDGQSSSQAGGVFALAGAGPTGTGGFAYINTGTNAGSPTVSSNLNLDTGSTARTFYIGKSTLTSGAPSTDFQMGNVYDSGLGGIIKTGPGTLKFNSKTVSFANSSIEIQQGGIRLIGGSSGGGTNPFIYGPTDTLLLDGSTADININGTSSSTDNFTFGAITVTAGTLDSSSVTSQVYTPSVTFNVASGSTGTVNANLGDDNAAGSLATSATFQSAPYKIIYTPGPTIVTSNGAGQVTFSGTDNTYTGGTTINNGGTFIASMNASGNPFGVGAIALNGSSLTFAPSATAGSGTAIAYGAANLAAGTQLSYSGGNTITVKAGNETSLAVTIGNSGATGSVLSRVGNGTLAIAANTGTANLGTGTEKLLLNGTAPTLTSGIVNTSIVGEDPTNNDSGDFLTYGATNGFAKATYTGDGNINDSTASTVFLGTGVNNALTANGAAYALNDGGQTLTVGGTLTIGNGSGQAGVILNGGAISGGTLAFGAAEGTVYTDKSNAIISSSITGTNGLTIFGPGTVNLTGTNTGLSGGLNLNQGVVDVTSDSNLGSTTNGIVFNGGTLQFGGTGFNPLSSHAITLNAGGGTIDTQTNNVTIASVISDGGSGGQLNKVGSGTLTLTGANNYSGLTNISAGGLQIGNGTTGAIGTGNITNNGALTFNTSGSSTVPGAISGSGTFTQAGPGTVILNGNNTFAGAVAVNAGELQLGNVNALSYSNTVTSTPSSATVSSSGTLDLHGNVVAKAITLNGGTLSNSTGTAGLSTGVIGYVVNSGGAGIADAAAETNGGGGTGASFNLLLGLTNATVPVASITPGSGYTTAPTITVSGGGGTGATAHAVLSGTGVGSIVIDNPGIGYLTAPSFSFSGGGGSGAAVVANGANFTAVGTQALTPGSGYTTAPTVTLAQNMPTVTGTAPVITPMLDSLSVQASSTINGAGTVSIPVAVTGTDGSGTAVLTLDGTSAGNSIGGPITDGVAGGNLGITKSNSSTWTLTGANTYSGPTAISGSGALQIGNGGPTGSLGTAAVSDNASLVFNLASSPTVSNAISGSGSVTQAGTGTVTLSGANSYGNTTVSSGELVINPTSTANTVALGTGAVNIASTGTLQLAINAGASSPFTSSQADITNQLLKMSSLTIASGGVLDVTNNHFNVADPGGLSNDSTFSNILGYVKNDEITSSDVNGSYGIGVVDGNAHVAGSPVSSGQIEVAYTLEGDANLDGKVDATDFGIFAPNFGATGFTLGWEGGDFNYDGKVDATDFGLFAPNFGQSDSGTAVSLPAADYAALDAFAAENGLSLTSVPEPASLGLLTLGAVGILSRRRRRTNA